MSSFNRAHSLRDKKVAHTHKSPSGYGAFFGVEAAVGKLPEPLFQLLLFYARSPCDRAENNVLLAFLETPNCILQQRDISF